jgi:hypothetical protein
MNYENSNITQRVSSSPLWHDLSKQDSLTLPYLLERYLLLENWNRDRAWDDPQCGGAPSMKDEIRYLHLLLADAVTVLLSHEERLRKLEGKPATVRDDPHQLRVLAAALEKIADEDYRGPRPGSAVIAHCALVKAGIRKP